MGLIQPAAYESLVDAVVALLVRHELSYGEARYVLEAVSERLADLRLTDASL